MACKSLTFYKFSLHVKFHSPMNVRAICAIAKSCSLFKRVKIPGMCFAPHPFSFVSPKKSSGEIERYVQIEKKPCKDGRRFPFSIKLM